MSSQKTRSLHQQASSIGEPAERELTPDEEEMYRLRLIRVFQKVDERQAGSPWPWILMIVTVVFLASLALALMMTG
ncbi:MAG: hypothetical protein WCF84_18690 [Anaerolineae bacterium]